MTFQFDIYQTMALVAVVFYLGKYLKNRIPLFTKYCIPPAVVGGFLFALVVLFFNQTGLVTLVLDTTLQNIFMTAFFTSIGFTASIKVLKKGGMKVITFLLVSTVLVILQNIVGVTLASFFDLSPYHSVEQQYGHGGQNDRNDGGQKCGKSFF